MKIHLAEAASRLANCGFAVAGVRYSIRVDSVVHFGSRLRAIESSVLLLVRSQSTSSKTPRRSPEQTCSWGPRRVGHLSLHNR